MKGAESESKALTATLVDSGELAEFKSKYESLADEFELVRTAQTFQTGLAFCFLASKTAFFLHTTC